MKIANGAAPTRRDELVREELFWMIANPLMAAVIGSMIAGWTGAVIFLILGLALVFAREIATVVGALALRFWGVLAPHLATVWRPIRAWIGAQPGSRANGGRAP